MKTKSSKQYSRGSAKEADIVNEKRTEETLTVNEVRRILKIGSNTAYSLIHSKAFPVIKVGHSYRIPALPFYHWLEGEKAGTTAPRELESPRGAAAQS